MPKVGMSSSSMVLAPWTKALQVAAENGFDAFEIDIVYPSADLDQITSEDIKNARTISEKTGIELCVHAPFFELNIAAFCQGIRAESVQYIKESVDLCADLKGKILVVHTGKYTYDYPPEMSKDNNSFMKFQWDYNIESLKKINDYAVSKGIIVCLENSAFEHLDKSFEELLEIREAVGDSLKFTLDIGHARINPNEDVKKGIQLLGENIQHIHFTDNNGEKDDHLPIGDGNFDYSRFIDFIRDFPHNVILEVVQASVDPSAILRSREYFDKI